MRLIDADELLKYGSCPNECTGGYKDYCHTDKHFLCPIRIFDIESINDCPTVEQTEWIPVTERLPEEYGHYLVTVDSKAIKEKLVATDDFFFPYGWDNYKDDVVAWMPLPSPYKGE